MQPRPSGTVTFLFTDIEGSTRLWESAPRQMSAALARHDELLRQAIEAAGGHVFKTVGDAFCAAFHTPQSALQAACAAQAAIAAEPWPREAPIRVRMGVHTGTVESRDGDYFGPPLNRVARLMSIGHGGQLLASLATQELVRDSLPAGTSLRDLGDVRLKDLVRPERVFQVDTAGSAIRFPALKSLDATRNNLPIQATSFFGREADIERAARLLAAAPMVTLVGPGGAGKTRLALQLAADQCERFSGGAWFVDLSGITDPALVANGIARALELKEEAGSPMADTLLRRLKEAEPTLIVLDNCEQVIDACADLCNRLVTSCPGVRVIATSREAMRVPGEATLQVPPLPSPEPGQAITPEALSQYAAVQLFIDRALAVKPGFTVDAANAPALASICHRLDGIPLAIELAAARVRSMGVNDINERLDKRFQLLTGGARTALPRQQTLRSLVDWSYDLLSPQERTVFERAAVFAGGFSMQAAEAVCPGAGVEDWEVLDLLSALADKSLLVAQEGAGGTRFRMLETIRQYAAEKLAASPSADRDAARQRHLAFFRDHVQPPPQAENGKAWLQGLVLESANLHAALAWALAHDVAAGIDLLLRIEPFWFMQGAFREALGWSLKFSRAATDGVDDASRQSAHRLAGLFGYMSGDYAAATAGFTTALELARKVENRREEAESLRWLGLVASLEERWDDARRLAEESLAILRELGEEKGVGATLNTLGIIADNEGKPAESKAYHEESLAIARKLGLARAEAVTLNCLGRLAADRGDHEEALRLTGQSLAMRRDFGIVMGLSGSFMTLGMVSTERGEAVRAARLFACMERLNEEMGLGMSARERREVDGKIAAASALFPDGAELDKAWAEGRAMSNDAAIAYALEGTTAAPG